MEQAGYEAAVALGGGIFLAFLAGRALAGHASRETIRQLRLRNRLLRRRLRQIRRRELPRVAYLRTVK